MSIIEESPSTSRGHEEPADPAPTVALEPVTAVIVADEAEIDRSFNEIVKADQAQPVIPVAGLRIRRLRLASVGRLTAGFTVITYIAGLATAVAVWTLLSAVGVVGAVESSIAEATGIDSYNISGWFLFKALASIGFVTLATASIASVVLAALYNRLSSMFGGLVVEAEAQPATVSS